MFNEIIERIYEAVEANHEANNCIDPIRAAYKCGVFSAYVDVLDMMGHPGENMYYYAQHFISGVNKKCIVISDLTIDGVTLLNDDKWTDEFWQKYGAIVKGEIDHDKG